MSKMKPVFLLLLVVILSISLVFYFYPIEAFQEIEIFRMKISGIKEIKDEQFHYFEKNNCLSGEKCQCVLLLHGLGDFALTWRKLMSSDEKSFVQPVRLYAVNLPGALDSAWLESEKDFNVQNIARLVGDFFVPQCPSWIVVGNSYGAWVSVFLAKKYSEVRSLILLGPAGLNKSYQHVIDYFIAPTADRAKDFYYKVYFKTQAVPSFIFDKVAERAKKQPALLQLKAITEEDFVDDHLGALAVPVYYLWGKADGVIPFDWAQDYLAKTPKGQLKSIGECGHVPQKECTKEVLMQLNEALDSLNENHLKTTN